MNKKILLLEMMLDVLKEAEDENELFQLTVEDEEYYYHERKHITEKFKLVFSYWVQEGLTFDFKDETEGYYLDNVSYYEFFLTELAYEEGFGFGSKRSLRKYEKEDNIFTSIRKKVEKKLLDMLADKRLRQIQYGIDNLERKKDWENEKEQFLADFKTGEISIEDIKETNKKWERIFEKEV